MAGIKEVAKLAGVSGATVSNVLGNKKPVSSELRERVEKAVKDLNYKANPLASGLKSRRTNNIGVILPQISSIYFPPVLAGINNMAKKSGYKLSYFDSNYEVETEKAYIELLKSNWADGIILDTCCDAKDEEEYAEYLSTLGTPKKRIPVVSLERNLCDDKINAVIVDSIYYSHKVTKYLIEAGRSKILHITGPLNLSMVQEIISGYKKALCESKIRVNEAYIKEGDYSPTGGYNTMKQFLNEPMNFDAVFASNDQMAIGAIKAIKEAGRKIPEDIAVVGFDNVFAGTLIEPALTTVGVPRYRIGCEAVNLLIKQIKNTEAKPETIKLECNLIIRQSSDIKGEKGWDLYGW